MWKAEAIQGGNVNYAFCVTDQTSGQTIFLKQAPEFVAIFGPDGFPLTSQRMQQEIDVYEEWKQLLGPQLSTKYLPPKVLLEHNFFYSLSFNSTCSQGYRHRHHYRRHHHLELCLHQKNP